MRHGFPVSFRITQKDQSDRSTVLLSDVLFGQDTSVILAQLSLAMGGSASDPTTLFVRPTPGKGGHVVTPYRVEDRGSGVYWVWVYDNNHPNDSNRYVQINATSDSWSYDLGGSTGTWSGDADTKTLGIVPVSLYMPQLPCPPKFVGTGTRAATPIGEIWFRGSGHLLIKDSAGNRIGYEGEQFVDEVPGAYTTIIDSGLAAGLEPIYNLPLTDTYRILIDGQTLSQAGIGAITHFGPGYAAWLDDIVLTPTSQDLLTIQPDALQLVYLATGRQEPTLSIAIERADASLQLQVIHADIGAGQVVRLTADADIGQLVFNNAQAGGGAYDLRIKRTSVAGEQVFFHSGLIISATDSHHIDYGSWDGTDPLTLSIDHGSDGTVEETLGLDNQREDQANRVHLPVVLLRTP